MFRSILLLSFIIILTNCSEKNYVVTIDTENFPFEQLSDYQFFTGDISEFNPNDGVLPYDLNSPLFTDYADKSRFVWMPEGSSAVFDEKEVFKFPLGAVLIKHFYYDTQEGRNIKETRILMNTEKGWDAATYQWNEDQSDAELIIIGNEEAMVYNHPTRGEMEFTYVIPDKNQCKNCHQTGGKFIPIGPTARSLNKEFAYADGNMNQLEKWEAMGYLKEKPATEGILKMPVWDDPASGSLHDRAMAYLEINCAHCHNPQGSANTSGLNFTIFEDRPFNLGICKAPVSAGKGAGDNDFDIVPGHPDKSITIYRMNSLDPGAMMPELGRSTVHAEGVKLIEEWIAAMDEDLCEE
ncbi:MAG: hypothetical protein DWQ02_04090 [Bacteroidetes bacterium]|nr:MAG: hypothetical protein DWQ02_04090 [Bacteroidota bacterium]